ncbi:carboxypeptidase regulatory-like domain-containing protein [Hymenobacter aquaticus]|uniref:Carboxypeptidase regulatory-like domain-containing protein n=1 Tax=Hymenobacter aquaticus TaxID=1867101 RepID=A0A4Z0Q5P7_9BACT|nr:carboxypeptidase-like regulatory domain-containing protein [Hymenobacter aquaticus]TGE24759.1 carboxypeptidase regulatory-like domain-containing protein [Hymenobacter aquaticus]
MEGSFTPVASLTKVTATPVTGGAAYTATIAFPGTYRFRALPLGTYSLQFEPVAGYVTPAPQTLAVQTSGAPVIRTLHVLTERAALMTAVKWRVTTNLTLNTTNGTTVDGLATAASCAKDNTLQFMPDGEFIIDQGPLKCAASDPQITKLTWALEQDETYIRFKLPTGATSYLKMIQVTATKVHMLERYTEQNQQFEHTLIYSAIP